MHTHKGGCCTFKQVLTAMQRRVSCGWTANAAARRQESRATDVRPHLLCLEAVQACCRLVQEDKPRLADQLAGNGQALLLAPRQAPAPCM